MHDFCASTLLRRARSAAGLTQRQLARRAGTSQSVVARIELGATDPSSSTLLRLLVATGYTLRCSLLRVAGAARGADGRRRAAGTGTPEAMAG